MPICVIGFVSWLKTLTDFDVIVDGWGGDTPSNSRCGATHNNPSKTFESYHMQYTLYKVMLVHENAFVHRSTACVAGVHYFWSPAITSAFSGASPSNRISDCTPFNELVTVPRPFFHLLAQLHWYEDAKLGMAADRAEDVPKLEKMRAWISENWYPRRRMRNIPMCRDNSLTHYPFRASGFDRKYNKKSCYPRVHYTHDGRRRSTMMGTISNFLDVTHVHGAGTTSEMDDYIRSPDYGVAGPKFAFAIVFHQIPGDGRPGSIGDWDYSIRMNYTFGSIGSTNFMPVRPLARGISDWHQDLYSWEGFASLQLLVDRYILNKRAQIQAAPLLAWNPSMAHYAEQEDADNHEYLAEPLRYAPQLVQTVPLPMHGYILDTFYEIVKAVFALLFLLMYMHPTFSMIAAFIDEKETRTREGLRMMGVRNGALIASAYALHACVFFVLNLLMTIASCGPSGAVFDKTSSSVVFVLLNLFSATAISFSYMIHNFYNKARTGAIAGALKFMCCYFIYASTFDFSEGNVKPGGSLSLCLFSPAAFSFGLSLLSQYEAAAIGAHWNNLDIDVGGGINLRTVMLMLVFDSIVYTVLGSYLEYVWPKEFGVQRPFWFPCVKSYWCPHHAQRDDVRAVNHLQHGAWSRARFRQLFTMPRQRQLSENEATAAITAGFDPTSGDGARDAASTSFVEEVTPSLKAQESTGNCLQIQGLRRTFSTPDGEKVAVAGLNLNIYEGQITALLGHNGAGKTTTIHMLTGLIEPTSGDALVYGKRLTTEMESIRQIIGVCPQHDVLFGLLTVLEHLQFYCRLKCPLMTAQELQDAVRDTVAGVGLTEKLHTRSNALSGGQKRKLSLGISLIGNPKVVFLDEPTSGMDPYSRRSTWNSLRAHREGRCMVLTSHFMDEV
jgi:ATP-binding cassette subfamily A (ABC1) protein 3